jgi:hypothetical protein
VNAFVRMLDRWGYRGQVNDLERRQRVLDQARFLIRAELTLAIAVPVIAGFMWVAAPGTMVEPMFINVPLFVTLLPLVGVVGFIVGIVWMLRLSRPDPEAGERSWRYRDF